jgi:UDP-N-acetyl-D-glucosamine dehydrogenase
MEARGADVAYYDPYVPVIPVTREHAPLAGRTSVDLSPRTVASYDAVLIATDHDEVDYRLVVEHAKVTIDTRNACARAGVVSDRIVKA